MPLNGDAIPRPKAFQLARGERRYRRKVASPKQWQAIIAAKVGPCRTCGDPATNGRIFGRIEFHHVVARAHGGDDVADNLVPLCPDCHLAITMRSTYRGKNTRGLLLAALTDAEYAYMIERGGESYPERAYGIAYSRTADNV